VLIGAMVGAGFASGKEIFLFFSKFGNIGILFSIFSSFLTGLIVYKTLKLIKYYDIYNYSNYISTISNKKRGIINNISNIIINSFLYFSFIIMISGFSSFLLEVFGLNSILSSFLISFFCFYLFNKKINKIINLNFVLIPFLIIIIFLYSSKQICINFSLLNLINGNLLNAFFSSILYSSYNSILLIPVIISLHSIIKNLKKKEIFSISFISFFILSILSVCIINLLFSLDYNIANSLNIPILYAIKNMSYAHYLIYGTIIIIAILTSAISSGYSFLQIFKDNHNYIYISALVCFSSILFCKVDFSFLVSTLYPAFGILGIVQILFLLLKKVPKTDIN